MTDRSELDRWLDESLEVVDWQPNEREAFRWRDDLLEEDPAQSPLYGPENPIPMHVRAELPDDLPDPSAPQPPCDLHEYTLQTGGRCIHCGEEHGSWEPGDLDGHVRAYTLHGSMWERALDDHMRVYTLGINDWEPIPGIVGGVLLAGRAHAPWTPMPPLGPLTLSFVDEASPVWFGLFEAFASLSDAVLGTNRSLTGLIAGLGLPRTKPPRPKRVVGRTRRKRLRSQGRRRY